MALGDKDYNVEFDDSVLSLKGWTGPRWEGCNLRSLYYNEYTTAGDHIKQLGTYQNANLETTMRMRLPETRYATGILYGGEAYGWWSNRWRRLNNDVPADGFGDPTVGAQGQAGHAFADTAGNGGMGPKAMTASFGSSYTDHNFNPNTNITYSGVVKLGPEEDFDLIPTIRYEGDESFSVLPTIQNTTNTIFVGTKVMGFKEDVLYPGPGPDYSYLVINKAITFDTDDDSFFIIENETDDDPTFEKLVQTNLPWSSKFRLKLLDDDQPHNLKKNYGVHYNRGLFSWVARYTAPYDTSKGDYQDDNGQWVRSFESIWEAKYDYNNLSTKVFLLESASNRYQIGYPGTPPIAFARDWGQFYGYNLQKNPTGIQTTAADNGPYAGHSDPNLISGSEGVQEGGAAPQEHTFNPILRFARTTFEWVNRADSSAQGIGTNMADLITSHGSTHKGGQLSGSITVNKDNKDIQWWFQEGGRKIIKYMNPVLSQSQNIKPQSFRRFIERLRDNPNDKLYALTINDSLNCDHAFKMQVEGTLPGANNPTNPINAGAGNYYDPRVLTQVPKPLVTFGTFPFDGSKVGVPGCSPNCIQWQNNYAFNRFAPNITIPEGYSPQFLSYAQMADLICVSGGFDGAGGDTTNTWMRHSWWGAGIKWVGNRNTAKQIQIKNAADGLLDERDFFTGSLASQSLLVDAADDGGYPDKPPTDNWVISCLEERNNIILSNINKKIDLSGGVGKKGFAIIAEDLNPEIRANLDYYLKKAELIASGPKSKDKNLIKHKPRPGFFKKRDAFGRVKKKK